MYKTKPGLMSRFLRFYASRSVTISESNDVYTNLAIEDWFYKNGDFHNKHVLMFWTNDPCVVIGKFQNPWMEANISELDILTPEGIKLARRNSGGGTVYHDRGNLNLTFFTPRDQYRRRDNLEVITRAVLKRYGLKIDISPREDLVVGERKVSGTASKLGRSIAYHHCTLLINANRNNLSKSLEKPNYEIKTNATRSVKSEILNLTDIDSSITVENLMVSIGNEYLNSKSTRNNAATTRTNEFQILKPREIDFPGLTDIRDVMAAWDWNFGNCPKFTATKMYWQQPNNSRTVSISLVVESGTVTHVSIDNATGTTADLSDDFTNRKFEERIFDEVYKYLNDVKYVRKIV